MKQQSLKYLLFGLVALVWGLIVYKIIKGLGGDDDKPIAMTAKKKIDYTAPADSFFLMADYPDPFIPAEDVADSVDQQNINISNGGFTDIPAPATENRTPAFDPSVIQYRGIIVNPEKRLKIAILSIAGKEYLAKENEMVDGYLVKKIDKDKLIIVYKRSSYTITKTNNGE